MNDLYMRAIKPNLHRLWPAATMAFGFAIAQYWMTPYMIAATVAYLCLVTGLLWRKNRGVHVPLMVSGIALDLLIVLSLELKRNAIKTAMAMTLSPLQQFHILFSTLAVIFYGPVVFYGLRRWRNQASAKDVVRHQKLGLTAFAFRTVGFILMFTLLWKK